MGGVLQEISICICTHNRCDQLKQTLQSLLRFKHSFIKGDEILVIDNNSSDETRNVVSEFEDLLPLFYYFESKQGLSAARNKGISKFKNRVIVFIDDDITIDASFIDSYRTAFSSYQNQGFFGGKIHVDWGEKVPKWYKSKKLPLINGFIGFYDQGEEDKLIRPDTLLPYGANFALRRKLIDLVGSFDIDLGVKGKQIGRGEESDYFQRALDLGLQGAYVANAKVYHRFQVERISMKYLYLYGVQKGVAAVKLNKTVSNTPLKKMFYQVFAGVYQLFKNRRDRFYQCVINIGIIRGIQISSSNNND